YCPATRQTAIWYLNNNAFVSAVLGPTLPVNWRVVGVADFNGDNHPDYLLFNSSTRQTAIWYLSGPTLVGGKYGPSIVSGYTLIGAADFNADGKPDYVLYGPSVQGTTLWYLDNNVLTGSANGPTLPAGWSLTQRGANQHRLQLSHRRRALVCCEHHRLNKIVNACHVD